MQRESARRGFTIQHQKVALNVDLAGFVRGYTKLTVVPLIPTLRTIHIHSRQCTIHSISVGETSADFVLHDPLSNLGPTKTDDVHSFPEVKRKLYSALSEADEGELSIAIPPSLLPVARAEPSEAKDNAQAPTRSSNAANGTSASTEFSPISVVVQYSFRNLNDGLEFVLPSDAYPYRIPHAYTTPISADSARCWVPCVDSLWERHPWDFEFVVPKALGGRVEDDMETRSVTSEEDEEEAQVVVICTGELVEKLAHPHDSNKTIFVYSQSAPTTVQHVAFSVGPFLGQTIPVDAPSPEAAQADGSGSGSGVLVASKTPMYVYCLPGLEHKLRSTTSFYRAAMNFFTSEYGSYPFTSHKLVFVDALPSSRFDASTLSLVSNDILHGDDAIEEVFDARQSLAHALACQWVGINIIPKQWADIWLVNGLGSYITALLLRQLFGNNEYRFRLRKDMDRVVRQDTGNMPPICSPGIAEPPDGSVLSFINLKAPLVLYILDRRLAKSGTALGLSRVLHKVFLSAISGEMTNNTLSTHSFLRTCRKVSAVDVRTFSDQWIYGSGCPMFTFHATFNKKKMAVELYMTQVSPAYQANEGDPIRMSLLKPVETFEGTFTLRIHEADGTPYEHVLDIRTSTKKYEILFNTKYKRVRRNTKRYLARKAAAAAAEAGDAEAAEALELIDTGFELKEWENEARRTYWMVADWTEEDEERMNGTAYEWIRLDADFEWIASISFEQPDYMWVSQLQRDRDVVAQLEALHALARSPTAVVSSTLTKTVLVTNYFYRVRAEAARLLISCAIPSLKDIGLLHLFKLFTRYCYKPSTASDPFLSKLVPRPNDFSSLEEYFVRKSLIIAVSEYRDPEGKTGPFVRRFLIDQLHYNDNTQNQFSDALYLCTIIAALGRTLLPGKAPELSELSRTVWTPELDDEDRGVLELANAEIERYRELDRLNPSPHNVISIAVIEWMSMLQHSSILPSDWRMFIAYTREGNYDPVRIAAFEALLLNKWFSRKSLARYLFAVIGTDSSRIVRRFVARAAISSLGILEAIGEIRGAAKEGDKALLVEEDGTIGGGAKGASRGEAELALKAIRKDAGKQKGIREIILPTYLSPALDHDTRLSVLKLGELMFRPDAENPPSLTAKLADIPTVPGQVAAPPPAPTPALAPATINQNMLEIYPPVQPEVKAEAAPVDEATMLLDAFEGGAAANGVPATPADGTPVPTLPKKKKDKPVPKAQSSGMGAKDVQTCRSVLKKLTASKTSYFFRIPVDPVRDHAPGYFERIKHPMDLSSMSFKLENGHYPTREALQNDLNLIIKNAKTYNPPATPVFIEAEKFQAFFEKTWAQVDSTLATMNRQKVPETSQPSTSGVVEPLPQPLEPLPTSTAPASAGIESPAPSRTEERVAEPVMSPSAAVEPPPKLMVKKEPKSTPRPSQTPTPAPAPVSDPPPAPKPTLKLKPPKPKPKPQPQLPDPSEDTADAVGDLESLFDPPPPPPPTTSKAAPKPPKAPVVEADMLLGELVDEIDVEPTVKPRGTPSWTSKKKGKDRADGKEKDSRRSSLFSPGSSRHSSPAIPLAAPSPAPTPVPKQTPVPKRTNSSVVPTKSRDSGAGTSSGAGAGGESHPIDVKRCVELIKYLTDIKSFPESTWFLFPVDAIASGCPTYYDEIKHPMDFQTLSANLSRGQYKTMEEFADAMTLIFRNCRQFNPPMTDPVIAADNVERLFRREWAVLMRGRLTMSEKKHLVSYLEKLRNREDFMWFRDPVDVNLLPNYNQWVPKKDMRDLGGIKSKVEANKYENTLEGVSADVTQLAKNAHKYNGSQDIVAILASKLEAEVHAEVASIRKSLKRKNGGDGVTPNKTGSSSNGNGAGSTPHSKSSMNGGPVPKKIKLSHSNGY